MKEDFHMEQTPSTTGKTTIAPEVLLTIARLNTLSVPGVARLSSAPADVNQIFSKIHRKG